MALSSMSLKWEREEEKKNKKKIYKKLEKKEEKKLRITAKNMKVNNIIQLYQEKLWHWCCRINYKFKFLSIYFCMYNFYVLTSL